MQVKINYKENIKRKDLNAILTAELTDAKKGDAKLVILLSKLVQKRIKNINTHQTVIKVTTPETTRIENLKKCIKNTLSTVFDSSNCDTALKDQRCKQLRGRLRWKIK